MCGKNGELAKIMKQAGGSPPRVREEQDGERAQRLAAGITPACAGRTYIYPFGRTPTKDHPRVCGKNGLKKLQ